jgi:hypothetical protein
MPPHSCRRRLCTVSGPGASRTRLPPALRLPVNSLSGDDQRFAWQARYGGDFDVFDYVVGRTSVLVDYEAILGSELRPFDPNQAYYVLELSTSYRAGDTELAAVFHHVSRHLSDRPKQFAIAWNVMGGRVLRRVPVGTGSLDLVGELGHTVQHSFVDYTWNANADIVLRQPVSRRVGVFGRAFFEGYGVDGTDPTRETQTTRRFEGGIRINGHGGALELFAGYERRLDADPIERLPLSWGLAGFRLVRN